MSLWGKKSASAIKPVPPKIRIEKVSTGKPSISSKLASRPQASRPQNHALGSSRLEARPTAPPPRKQDAAKLQPQKRKSLRQKSPTQQRIESDSDDDGSSTSFDDFSQKRQKLATNRPVDMKRRLRSEEAFAGKLDMIHAADVASVGPKSRLPANSLDGNITVELKYPSLYERER